MKQYVMVPVPESLEREVHRFVMALDMRAVAASGAAKIDTESVARLLPALTSECRTALDALARACVAEKNLSIAELSQRLHWKAHETVGVVQELQEVLWEVFGPKITVVATGPIASATTGIDWDAKEVIVWKELGEAVVEAEQQLATET